MKLWLRFVSWFNRKAKNFSIRLVKWTGKSKEYTHPKHLIHDETHYWFVPYLESQDMMLDLGCGDGSHTIVAANSVARISAVDHNTRNVEIAQRRAREKGKSNVKFRVGNLEEPLSEPGEEYTAVLALDILEHLHNRDQFLKEIHRVLKRKGKLILSIPNSDTSWKKALKNSGLFFYSDLDHKYEYQESEVRDIFKRHQFEIEKCEPTVYDTPWVGVIDIIGGISMPVYRALSKWKRDMALRYPAEATGFRIIARKI